MPRIVERDAAVATRIRAATRRLEARQPTNPRLRSRLDAGTLRVNFNTVEMESGVKRHLFDRPGTPYAAEHQAIVTLIPARGSVEPLRKQLDRERKLLQQANLRLDRSRSYAAQLLIRMQKMDVEIARLKDLLENGPGESDDDPFIGTGRMTSLPPLRRNRKPSRRADGGQSRGVGT